MAVLLPEERGDERFVLSVASLCQFLMGRRGCLGIAIAGVEERVGIGAHRYAQVFKTLKEFAVRERLIGGIHGKVLHPG
jgi:hypothetical protein